MDRPIIGAVMPLTRGRLAFLAAHGITGIEVPTPLRDRVSAEDADAALRRLALDLASCDVSATSEPT